MTWKSKRSRGNCEQPSKRGLGSLRKQWGAESSLRGVSNLTLPEVPGQCLAREATLLWPWMASQQTSCSSTAWLSLSSNQHHFPHNTINSASPRMGAALTGHSSDLCFLAGALREMQTLLNTLAWGLGTASCCPETFLPESIWSEFLPISLEFLLSLIA